MSIVIDENIEGIWFVALPGNAGDFLAGLSRTTEGYSLQWRFRYYRDAKAFDSEDVKSWYKASGSDLAKGLTAAQFLVAKLSVALGEGSKSWELLRGTGTVDDFMRQFRELPFAHVQEVAA